MKNASLNLSMMIFIKKYNLLLFLIYFLMTNRRYACLLSLVLTLCVYTFNQEMSDFKEKLVCWSVKHCVTKRALNALLTILIIYGFNFLPKDSRTRMKTPTTIDIRALSKGQMWYHGLQKNLHSIFNKVRRSGIALSSTIHLDFNFDGVELFNSSKKCFWPIIASIRGIFESIHVYIIHELF